MTVFIKKYYLNLANFVCLFWCSYITVQTCITTDFEAHYQLLMAHFILVYISMMLMWLVVFAFLKPTTNDEHLYKSRDVLLVFIYCVLLVVPFFAIGYFVERSFVKELATFDHNEFIELYALRTAFQFGLAMTFKYLTDSRELARTYFEQTQQLQVANTKAQFEILKQQINPHFLFNALSTLKSLIRIQDPQAEAFVMSLSDVYRKLLTRRDKELIRLSDEMDIVNSYLFMQQLRFENNLIIKTDIKTEELKLFIPPFALQLLIENTIKHNVISQRKPLIIRLCVKDNKIIVENTKQPKKTTEESTGWGLSSLIERYTSFTLMPIDIKETDTLFSVALPLLKEG
jgi:two-component system, LytTR family, sensor kinase